ncbi:PREDICTED: uncharacterized protein LOC108771566 [Cyphomyrmex costatus]|uniref:uncharacterized protein LOC108771566 n=1 Tax=Cyphomyrmex costatus TaxID=456900 RepID=UPI0008522119|nr:PREDICTED: uncharacterized protein LOC108771566 [Cyphomyrmex costatus]
MAAVVYVRVELHNGDVQVNLACSKTKIAPLKKLTIPRLELNAALILTRLAPSVRNSLNLRDTPIRLWTDSSVAFYWISSHPAKLKDYVRNRVSSIQEILPSATWRFVPGRENPADCASRGLSPSEIKQHSLWWSGPPWLRLPSDNWPELHPKPPVKIDLEETSHLTLNSLIGRQKPPWDLLERYSSLTKLLRVTATCKRAISRFRRLPIKAGEECITPTELQSSCSFWVLQVQKSHFFARR